MSDDEPLSGPTYQQRLAARLQQEYAELDDPVVKVQLQTRSLVAVRARRGGRIPPPDERIEYDRL